MAHYVMIGPPLPSHIFTLGALGRELQARGHIVTAVGLRDVQGIIEAEELSFHAIGEQTHPPGEVPLFRRRLAEAKGIAGLRLAMHAVCKLNETLFAELPGILRELGADVLIADQAEPAAGTVADHVKLPWVTVCNGLPINREISIPPYFTSWNYRPDGIGRLRNRAGYAIFDAVTASIRKGVQRRRRAWGLPPYCHPNDADSPVLQLAQIAAEFDFPRTDLPKHFHYIGPFRRAAHQTVEFPWNKLTRTPLVYASMGTLQNRLLPVFRTIAEASERLGAQLVISLGRGIRVHELGILPGSPIVVEYAPQMELLKRADLFITHGGLNSVQEALMEGVPCLAIPITSDQGGVAARLKWVGAGEMIQLSKLSATKLQAAMDRILRNNSVKANARRLQKAMQNSGGVSKAADLVERKGVAQPEGGRRKYKTAP